VAKYLSKILEVLELECLELYVYVLLLLFVTVCMLLCTPWSIKMCHYYFLNSSMKHWPILINFGIKYQEELYTNGYSFGHLTLILSLTLLFEMQVIEPAVSRDCDPGILAIFANPESRDWRRPNLGISGLQKLVKIVPFRMLNDTIKNFSCMKNKIFYVCSSPTLCCAL